MDGLSGFWSYVHDDDTAENKRISSLANDVKEEFELLTGEPLIMFVDKNDLRWGDEFRDKISSYLASGNFFIPVLTPRYFKSKECRQEIREYINASTSLGVKELILPIYYVEVAFLHEEDPEDDLITLIKNIQRVDWRDLRFADLHTEEYRRGINLLAKRLQEASLSVEKVDMAAHLKNTASISVAGNPSEDTQVSNENDDTPGYVDQLATFEDTIRHELPATLELIKNDIELIGEIMQEGSSDIQKGNERGKGFVSRLVVSRKIAKQLEEPVEQIWLNSNNFATQLHDIDTGIRIIIERAVKEVEEEPENKDNFCIFINSVRMLSESIKTGFLATQGLIDSISPLEQLSKDLRPVLRRLRSGLMKMMEAGDLSQEWVQLIDESNIECDSTEK